MKVKRCLYFWLLQVLLQVIVSTLLHYYHYYHYYYYCYCYCLLSTVMSTSRNDTKQNNKIQKHFVYSLCVEWTYALSQLNTLFPFPKSLFFSGFLGVVYWMIYAKLIIAHLIRNFLDPKVNISIETYLLLLLPALAPNSSP